MSKGVALPACAVCKWAKKEFSAPIRPEDHDPEFRPIECQKHGFLVWLPSNHVCADLSDIYDSNRFWMFKGKAGLESGFVYAWLEFMYYTKDKPKTPQYQDECVKLATFDRFRGWSLEEKETAYNLTGEGKFPPAEEEQ